MFSLVGKKALVTGASRGIGRGIALAMAQAGADVVVNFHSNPDKANAVVKEIEAMGRQAFAVQADVAQKSEIVAMFSEVKNKFGKLDILVNNAGIVKQTPFEQITEDEWNAVVNTNLRGQFFCIQEAVKLMDKGGRIVNISSIASGGVGVGFGALAHYTASKGGVVAMTEDLAIELGARGININSVAPGVINTDMSAGVDPKVLEGMMSHIPKHRIGQPEDIAAAAVFLASQEADYITGTVIYVDGGWLTV